MTAILGCACSTEPMLFGDVIESIAEPYAAPYPYIPSVGRINVQNPHSKYRISGLVQKIAILGPNLAFAWAGDVQAAKNVLEALRDTNSIERFDWPTLARLLDNDFPSIIDGKVSLIGLLCDGPSWRMFARNATTQENSSLVGIFGAGSGVDLLIPQVQTFQIQPQQLGQTPTHSVIGLGCALAGTLITHELHHLDSLRVGYGGAYEIATRINGECSKIPDNMNVLWQADLSAKGVFELKPSKIIRSEYWRDLLVIRTANLSGSDEGQRDEYTLVRSIFRELNPDDYQFAPIPSLAASIVSHHITFRAPDQDVYTLTKVSFGEDASFRIVESKIADDKHKIEAHFAHRLVDELAQAISRIGGSK